MEEKLAVSRCNCSGTFGDCGNCSNPYIAQVIPGQNLIAGYNGNEWFLVGEELTLQELIARVNSALGEKEEKISRRNRLIKALRKGK